MFYLFIQYMETHWFMLLWPNSVEEEWKKEEQRRRRE
jgi:hypothetical protein